MGKVNKAIFKEKTNKSITKYFIRSNEVFFKFVSSQVIDAIVLGILAGIIMWIMGIKYGALLALMIGLFNMIPVLGSIIATILAALITLLTGGIPQALWLLLVITILQQIDANVINPRLVGGALKISPILIIFAVTVFGAYFGILGMFLAVPIIAMAKILLNDYLDYRIKMKENREEID